MPISRVRSRIMVCMFIRTTRKLMTMPRPTIVLMKGLSSGEVGGVHQGNVFGHGADTVLRVELEDFGAGGVGVAFTANKNHGDVVLSTDDVLPGFKRDEEPRAFAVGHDTGDFEKMIDQV